jgi:hypothetical protein
LRILVRVRLLLVALAASLVVVGPDSAVAHPCDPRPILRPPSAELLSALAVLRRPPALADLAPKEIREDDTRPHVTAIRWVPLGIGGGVWVVPLFDVSDRVFVTEACIRTIPRRYRARLRRLKRLSRSIRPEEGLELLPYDAAGESLGQAQGPSFGVRQGEFVFESGDETEGATTVYGLAPDGVASVRVRLVDLRPGRPDPPEVVSAPVTENAFGVRVPRRFEFALEARVTWLDAAGAVVPQG